MMLITTIIVISKTNHSDLYKLYDSSGNDCGTGDVKDYPLLYMQSFRSPFKSVCVKECPKFDYNQIKYNSTGSLNHKPTNEDTSAYSTLYLEASTPLYFIEFNEKYAGRSSTHTLNMDDKEIFGYDDGFANGYYSENEWNNYLSNMQHINCFPNEQFSSCEYKENEFWVYDSYPVLNLMCVPVAPKTALHFFKISSQINHGVIGDILDAKVIFFYCGLISLIISLVFLVATRYMGNIIIWVMMVVVGLLLILASIMILLTFYYDGPMYKKSNHLRMKYSSYFLNHKVGFHILAILLFLLGIYIFYVIFKKRQEIKIALPLLNIAARVSIKHILLIVLSLVVVICQILVILIELYVMLRLFTMGEEESDNDQTGSPFVFFKLGFWAYFILGLHIFGTVWLLIFLNNLNDFINCAVTVNYYFETKLKNLNIFCHSFFNNSGTIAWTIVLLPTLIIKTIFWPLKWLFTSENPNKFQNSVNDKCHSCCLGYEYMIDSICENYMALSYMGSEGFLISTRRYFYLTQKYLEEHQTVSLLSFIYNLLGKCFITIISGYCGVVIFGHNLELQQNVKYVGVVFFLFYFISFFLGNLFINLFSTCYDTIIICYLVEYNIYEQMHGDYGLQANEEIKEALKDCIHPESKSYVRLLNK